ncbi:hypothetical protein SFA32_14765 [Buttiauxella sp. HR94]|nr:hypothetical protein SFA32_14765 [Buttiauxella sp. HR94]
MLFQIIKLIFETFNRLPAKNKEQIIDTVTDLFQKIFKSKKQSKEEGKDKDENLKDLANQITEPQWEFTSLGILNSLPMSLTEYKKKKFTDSVIKLVQSEEFLEELERRIDKIDSKENDLYEEQCSLEMRKLIAEMLRK